MHTGDVVNIKFELSTLIKRIPILKICVYDLFLIHSAAVPLHILSRPTLLSLMLQIQPFPDFVLGFLFWEINFCHVFLNLLCVRTDFRSFHCFEADEVILVLAIKA